MKHRSLKALCFQLFYDKIGLRRQTTYFYLYPTA